MNIFHNTLLYLGAIFLVSLIVWGVSDAAMGLGVFSLGVLAFLMLHMQGLHALQCWFLRPDVTTIPQGYGLCDDVFAKLYQYERSNQAHHGQLNTAVEQFNLTAEALPDGLVVLTPGNQVEWCTPNAERQLGLDLTRDKNKPVYNILRDSDFIAYLYHGDYSEPFKLKSRLQPDVVFEVRLIPFAGQQKLLICRDMTQLEKVETMRRDFIANVSHELRTPLTVVGGFLETIMDMHNVIPDHLRRYFDMMQDQTGRMRRIIEDLLTLSRLESTAQAPEEAEIDMPKMLTMLQHEAEGLSQGKHRIRLVAQTGCNLQGCHEELLSAFSNLVSNAIRYTPEGGEIEIGWQLRGSGQAVMSVRDSGIGIAPEHIHRLTERFYRVDKGRSRDTGGTGLGLSIVKHILNHHQARLEISSEVGKGSLFSILFPQQRVLHKD